MIAAEHIAAEPKPCPCMVSPTNVTRPGEHRFDIEPIFDKTLLDDDAANAITIEDDVFSTPKRTSSDAEFADAMDYMTLVTPTKRSTSTSPASKPKKRKASDAGPAKKQKREQKPKDVELEDDVMLEQQIEDMFCDIFTDEESVLRTYLLRHFRFSESSRDTMLKRGVPIEQLNGDLRNPESLTHVVIGKDESDRIACLDSDCRRMLTTVGKWEKEYAHFSTEASLAFNALRMVRNKALELQSACHTDENGTIFTVHEYARQTLKARCEKNGLHRYKNKYYAWSARPKQHQ
jgi:hypothetical protein